MCHKDKTIKKSFFLKLINLDEKLWDHLRRKLEYERKGMKQREKGRNS